MMKIGRKHTQGFYIKLDYWGGQAPPPLKYWGASGPPGPPGSYSTDYSSHMVLTLVVLVHTSTKKVLCNTYYEPGVFLTSHCSHAFIWLPSDVL